MIAEQLLQLRVLRFRLLQDGDVGVGVFPQCEEILISHLGFDCVALQSVGAGETQVRQRSDWFVENNSAMIKNLLKLSRSLTALVRG